MDSSRPIVLDVQSVQELVQHVLEHHAPPSTLIVCSTRDAFLELLSKAPETFGHRDGLDNWLSTPALRLLTTSRALKVAFCPDIAHLRAYLATYSIAVAGREGNTDKLQAGNAQPILAMWNAVELHRPTSAFSAQGLNRTFSIAVEAAHFTNSKLILAECGSSPSSSTAEACSSAPWDEELSILNVTTRRLGDISVGRTVKVRTVASRWCTFEKMPKSTTR